MDSTRTWRATTLILLVALIVAVARSTTAAPQTHEGDTVKKVKVTTETVPNTIDTGGVFGAQLPGAVINVGVPDGTQALLLIRFTAESSCYGRVKGWCSLEFQVEGSEPDPTAGDTYAFDSVNPEGAGDYEGHAAERVAGPLGPGTYTVGVLRRIHVSEDPPFLGKSVFRLDDWTLTVERVQV